MTPSALIVGGVLVGGSAWSYWRSTRQRTDALFTAGILITVGAALLGAAVDAPLIALLGYTGIALTIASLLGLGDLDGAQPTE